jgi:hypothetical protein
MTATALQTSPDWLQMASGLLEKRRVAEALQAYDRAERQGHPQSQCAAGRWFCWMLAGDFESAWRESDLIEATGASDPNRLWDGRSFEGKRVLLRALHGYGDAIQFIRYAPLIRRRAKKLIVQTHPEMIDLMRSVEGVDEAITWPDSPSDRGRWDQQIEIMELPRAFRTTANSVPARVPYVSIESTLIAESRKRLPRTSKPRVGLLWASSQYNVSRSMRLEVMAPLLAMRRFEFHSFQRGPERDELERIGKRFTIHDTAQHSASMLDTAADLSNMDLIISVDTFAAHLAGALNRTVWLMLPWAADWRWMLDTEMSPWYPSMRLFRQPAPGDWKSVIASVARTLNSFRVICSTA